MRKSINGESGGYSGRNDIGVRRNVTLTLYSSIVDRRNILSFVIYVIEIPHSLSVLKCVTLVGLFIRPLTVSHFLCETLNSMAILQIATIKLLAAEVAFVGPI